MTKNVHIVPTHRRAGRRRERPVPGLPLADVITFETRDTLTFQEQLAAGRATIQEVAQALLLLIQAMKVLDNKLGALSRD